MENPDFWQMLSTSFDSFESYISSWSLLEWIGAIASILTIASSFLKLKRFIVSQATKYGLRSASIHGERGVYSINLLHLMTLKGQQTAFFSQLIAESLLWMLVLVVWFAVIPAPFVYVGALFVFRAFVPLWIIKEAAETYRQPVKKFEELKEFAQMLTVFMNGEQAEKYEQRFVKMLELAEDIECSIGMKKEEDRKYSKGGEIKKQLSVISKEQAKETLPES